VLGQIERHPDAAQAFLPLDVARYLVTVMPSRPGRRPDPTRARAFAVPGTLGVIYRAGAWHAAVTVLDRDGAFSVLQYRGGPRDDEVVPIPPLTVTLPQPAPIEALP
jgi:ureidoglycolate lyase